MENSKLADNQPYRKGLDFFKKRKSLFLFLFCFEKGFSNFLIFFWTLYLELLKDMKQYECPQIFIYFNYILMLNKLAPLIVFNCGIVRWIFFNFCLYFHSFIFNSKLCLDSVLALNFQLLTHIVSLLFLSLKMRSGKQTRNDDSQFPFLFLCKLNLQGNLIDIFAALSRKFSS